MYSAVSSLILLGCAQAGADHQGAVGGIADFLLRPPHLSMAQVAIPLEMDNFARFLGNVLLLVLRFLGNVLLLVLIVYMVRRTFPARSPSLEEQFEIKGAADKLRADIKDAEAMYRAEMNERFRGLSSKMDSFRAETRGDIALLRTEITQREEAQQRNYQTLISAVGELRGQMSNRGAS